MASKVLLIDDNANLLKLISIILRQSGFEVEMAHSGKLGLSLAESGKPDLVLLDVMMPDMNGYEVCKQLRDNPTLNHTRIILFSAMSRRKDKETGFDAGADDYLIKPIHPVELVNKVREVLGRAEEEAAQTKSGAATVRVNGNAGNVSSIGASAT